MKVVSFAFVTAIMVAFLRMVVASSPAVDSTTVVLVLDEEDAEVRTLLAFGYRRPPCAVTECGVLTQKPMHRDTCYYYYPRLSLLFGFIGVNSGKSDQLHHL